MTRFYFDVLDGRFNKDNDGLDLPDLSKVCAEVKRTLAELIVNSHLPVNAIVNVRDQEQRTVLTASISVAVDHPDTHH